MKRKHFGSDFDTQRNGITKVVNKAYIVYWDKDYNVVQESVMHSETSQYLKQFEYLHLKMLQCNKYCSTSICNFTRSISLGKPCDNPELVDKAFECLVLLTLPNLNWIRSPLIID